MPGLLSQTGSSSSVEKTAINIYKGISESVSWYDIPFAAFMVSRNTLFTHDQNKFITFSAFDFDYDLQGSFGKNGRHSLGSMDPNTIPSLILYSRAAVTAAINIISPESISETDYKKIFLFYKSIVYTNTITEIAKNLIKRKRPDRSDTRSFFSGHTSITFAAASFLYREVDDQLDDWYPSSEDNFLRTGLKTAAFTTLYGWAGYVAWSRLYDNKHYLSDVLLGAAAGTLISNFLYNFYLDEGDSVLNNLSIGIVNNNPAVTFNLTF